MSTGIGEAAAYQAYTAEDVGFAYDQAISADEGEAQPGHWSRFRQL